MAGRRVSLPLNLVGTRSTAAHSFWAQGEVWAREDARPPGEWMPARVLRTYHIVGQVWVRYGSGVDSVSLCGYYTCGLYCIVKRCN